VISSMTNQQYKKRYVFLIYAALALATFAAYEQVCTHDFISYDDPQYVYENQHVMDGLTWNSIKWAFTSFHSYNWHPLTWLSHMLDWQLFGNNPGWHHLTNLLFHIASTLLLFAVLKRMTGALWRSAFVAGAFALHPLHVESVAWIAERKDYVRYTERPGIARYLLVLLIFSLGLMAKPMLVTLPFVLLLLDYWPLGRLQWPQKASEGALPQSGSARVMSIWHLVREKIPLFVLSAASCVVTYIAQQSGGAVTSIEYLSLKLRIINAMTSYLGYIVKVFYPSHLAVFYPYPKEFRMDAAILLLVGIFIIFYRLAGRRPWLKVGLLWYLGTLVPVIGLVQVGNQFIADRYTYIPSIGLFIVGAWGVAEITEKWRYRNIALSVLTGAVFVVLFVCTWVQVKYWQNSITLYEHAVEVTKDNSLMHNNYGVALLKKGRLDEAIEHFSEVLRINPRDYTAYNNLGIVLEEQGRISQAVENWNKALEINPDYPFAHYHLGCVLKSQGKYDEAIEHFDKALRANPDWPAAHCGLGAVLQSQGKLDEAARHYIEALRLGAGSEGHYLLGTVYSQQGKFDMAVIQWTEALKLKPDSPYALNDLSRILAATEDARLENPVKAVEFAQRACKLTGYSRADFMDTLAIAYAANGNFSEAIKTAEEAIKLAEASGEEELAEQIKTRLQLYKDGQPYRQK
jgi:tetratricopeptide (TPR) repeat protein